MKPHQLPKPRGREIALKILYQDDLLAGIDAEVVENMLGDERDKRAVRYARRLIDGVRSMRLELDAAIGKWAQNWTLERMAAIDRTVLRIGLFELYGPPAVPFKVAIDQAVKLADKFGSESSASFVNGILHRASQEGSL